MAAPNFSTLSYYSCQVTVPGTAPANAQSIYDLIKAWFQANRPTLINNLSPACTTAQFTASGDNSDTILVIDNSKLATAIGDEMGPGDGFFDPWAGGFSIDLTQYYVYSATAGQKLNVRVWRR